MPLFLLRNLMPKIDYFMKDSIGIFDSGIGGLTVYAEIRKKLPHTPIIYFADQKHVPYGTKELREVLNFSKIISQYLIDHGARMIVVACNTASAAALYPLRKMFPEIPFVGMEPAVKPAAESTHTGVVGVLATPATFQGQLYNSVVERFAKHVTIFKSTCPGLVQEIEKGNFTGKKTRQILQEALSPMQENQIDTVVLGCTHYPFVLPLIREIVGNSVQIIDPGPAVAKQVEKVKSTYAMIHEPDDRCNTIFITSGSKAKIERFIDLVQHGCYKLEEVRWKGSDL